MLEELLFAGNENARAGRRATNALVVRIRLCKNGRLALGQGLKTMYAECGRHHDRLDPPRTAFSICGLVQSISERMIENT